ncbi:hypothetical protein [Streptomyces sp. NPDC006463]|uniref:hypothetical protein n=1 Tax=Streptomyces sp. NPDC006463 TaxID=3364746 RepID=UPI0036B82619
MAGQQAGGRGHVAQTAPIARGRGVALAATGAPREHIVEKTVRVVGHDPEPLPAALGPLRAGTTRAPGSMLVHALFPPGCPVEVDAVAVLVPAALSAEN